MNECTPIEMRESLKVVSRFKQLGINFIAVPVVDAASKAMLIKMTEDNLDILIEQAEKEDKS